MKTAVRRKYRQANALSKDVDKMKKLLAETNYDIREKALELINQSIENAKEKSADAHEKVANFTYQKPLRSLGVAALAGALVGFAISKFAHFDD